MVSTPSGTTTVSTTTTKISTTTTTPPTTTTRPSTTTTKVTTTTVTEFDTYCGTNLHATVYQICGALNWHCNTQTELEQVFCSDANWGTKACCASDATSCDKNELMADGDQIFNEWYQVIMLLRQDRRLLQYFN